MKNAENIMEFEGLDLELFICTEVLKLKSLHYGYWEQPDELNIANVRKAQARYTETLVDFIPDNVKNILDVGCGIGDLSKELARLGYNVTAISPDKNHGKFFDKVPTNLNFVNNKFELFHSDQKYDLIIMSESQNYFDPELGLQQCKKLLSKGGYLLISGMFRKDETVKIGDIFNIEEDYVKRADKLNIKLLKKQDITANVLPTMNYTHSCLVEYVNPSIKTAKHFLLSNSTVKSKLMTWVFSRQLKKFNKIMNYYLQRTNPEFFTANVKYLRLLFKVE
jgi:2-polyprenyl-3-methyl-5-hydroxy-6-metoxy-1,4-benzoquinol methylase